MEWNCLILRSIDFFGAMSGMAKARFAIRHCTQLFSHQYIWDNMMYAHLLLTSY